MIGKREEGDRTGGECQPGGSQVWDVRYVRVETRGGKGGERVQDLVLTIFPPCRI